MAGTVHLVFYCLILGTWVEILLPGRHQYLTVVYAVSLWQVARGDDVEGGDGLGFWLVRLAFWGVDEWVHFYLQLCGHRYLLFRIPFSFNLENLGEKQIHIPIGRPPRLLQRHLLLHLRWAVIPSVQRLNCWLYLAGLRELGELLGFGCDKGGGTGVEWGNDVSGGVFGRGEGWWFLLFLDWSEILIPLLPLLPHFLHHLIHLTLLFNLIPPFSQPRRQLFPIQFDRLLVLSFQKLAFVEVMDGFWTVFEAILFY